MDVAAVEDALQRKALDYDREGDRHYDFVSAWIKATRGSDVDASLYYLAVMLEGERTRASSPAAWSSSPPRTSATPTRRRCSSPTPRRARSTASACPSARSTSPRPPSTWRSPKSNASYKALGRARGEVRENGAKTPPDYLRDAHYPGAAKLGRGEGYRYAHDEPGAVSDQPLLPPEIQGRRFYEPTGRGFEAELGKRLEALRRRLSAISRMRNFLERGCFSGRLSKLEPGRADIPAGGLDWGPPAGTKGESGGTDDRAHRGRRCVRG